MKSQKVVTLNQLNQKLKSVHLKCFFKNCEYLIAPDSFTIKTVSVKNALAIVDYQHHLSVNGYTEDLNKAIRLILQFAHTPNNLKVNSDHLSTITNKQFNALSHLTGYIYDMRVIDGLMFDSMTAREYKVFRYVVKLFKTGKTHQLKSTSYQTQYLFKYLISGMKHTEHDVSLDNIESESSTHY